MLSLTQRVFSKYPAEQDIIYSEIISHEPQVMLKYLIMIWTIYAGVFSLAESCGRSLDDELV